MVDGRYRCWEDFEKFGFVSAGHGDPDSAALRKIRPGDELYVYSEPRGYFAWASVIAEAVLPRDFIVEGDFVHLQDGSSAGSNLPIDKLYTKRSYLRNDQDNPNLAELLLRVCWKAALPRRRSKSFDGIQIPTLAAEVLKDSETEAFLRRTFTTDAQ